MYCLSACVSCCACGPYLGTLPHRPKPICAQSTDAPAERAGGPYVPTLTPQTRVRTPHTDTPAGEQVPFFACGVSLVIHGHNPHVPTSHANYRYFVPPVCVSLSACVCVCVCVCVCGGMAACVRARALVRGWRVGCRLCASERVGGKGWKGGRRWVGGWVGGMRLRLSDAFASSVSLPSRFSFADFIPFPNARIRTHAHTHTQIL